MRQMYDYMLYRIYHFFRQHPGDTPSVQLSVALVASAILVMNVVTLYLVGTFQGWIPQLSHQSEKISLILTVGLTLALNFLHLQRAHIYKKKETEYTSRHSMLLFVFLGVSTLSFVVLSLVAHRNHLG